MNIYDRIKMLRQQNKMSQTELAKKCGYSEKSMISRIEAGDVDLPFSKVSVFAEALGVDPAYLAGFSDWQENQDAALEMSNLIEMASRLDEADRARVAERIEMLLEDSKYED